MATGTQSLDVLSMRHCQFMTRLIDTQAQMQHAASDSKDQAYDAHDLDWWWSWCPTTREAVQLDLQEITGSAGRMWNNLKHSSNFTDMCQKLSESNEEDGIVEITNDLSFVHGGMHSNRSDYRVAAAHSFIPKLTVWPTYFQLRPSSRLREPELTEPTAIRDACFTYQAFTREHGLKQFSWSSPPQYKLAPLAEGMPIELVGKHTEQMLHVGGNRMRHVLHVIEQAKLMINATKEEEEGQRDPSQNRQDEHILDQDFDPIQFHVLCTTQNSMPSPTLTNATTVITPDFTPAQSSLNTALPKIVDLSERSASSVGRRITVEFDKATTSAARAEVCAVQSAAKTSHKW